jgi:hypothetical protein
MNKSFSGKLFLSNDLTFNKVKVSATGTNFGHSFNPKANRLHKH